MLGARAAQIFVRILRRASRRAAARAARGGAPDRSRSSMPSAPSTACRRQAPGTAAGSDVAPLVADLETWMRAERGKLSRHNDVAKAMDYMLKRWAAFTRFLDDGRICLTNNAAERALRGVALGRKAWLFAGSDRGGERAAAMYTLITTAKLNDVDPRAWLADVLRRIADHPVKQLDELLPWNRRETRASAAIAALSFQPRHSPDGYGSSRTNKRT